MKGTAPERSERSTLVERERGAGEKARGCGTRTRTGNLKVMRTTAIFIAPLNKRVCGLDFLFIQLHFIIYQFSQKDIILILDYID